jgi:hypothetical protein
MEFKLRQGRVMRCLFISLACVKITIVFEKTFVSLLSNLTLGLLDVGVSDGG